MEVKVGNKIYDGIKKPIMVILTQEDKKNIAEMVGKKYCIYSSTKEWTENNYKKIKAWMKEK